jgi:hypothetical protein
VDGKGKLGCLAGLLGAGIRLGFGSRRERGNLDPQRGRGVDAVARREQEEAAAGFGGNRDRLGEIAGGVADELEFDRLAGLGE